MFVNHCHVSIKGFGLERDKPQMGTVGALVQILNDLGVEGAVLFAPFGWEGGDWAQVGGGLDRNEWLAGELKKYPRLRGFANVFPQDHDASRQLRKAIEMGLVGAKVHPPVMKARLDDLDLEPFWQTAEELRIPISIHTGAHGWNLRHYMPLVIDDIAQRHPKLPIILEHVGGVAFFNQALAVLHNNKNCYAGLTQCSGRDPMYALGERRKILLETVGPDRIIYGFDYPWNPNNYIALKDDIAWLRGWDISDVDKEKIMGGNLKRLIAR